MVLKREREVTASRREKQTASSDTERERKIRNEKGPLKGDK